MSGLRMEQGCSVVMGESCKNDKKDQSMFLPSLNYTTWYLSSPRGHSVSISSFPKTWCVCYFSCISLVVLRRGNGAWRQVFTVPKSAKGCLIGCGQQGGRARAAVRQSAHAGDRCRRDWIRGWLDWYCRACCSWGEKSDQGKKCLRKFQQCL